MSPTRREVIKTALAVGAMPEVVGAPRADAAPQSLPAIPLPTPRAKALMETFGLKYPIFEAPHGNQTCPELCIAVANAGAMGALAAFIFDSEATARKAVTKVRSATKGNFSDHGGRSLARAGSKLPKMTRYRDGLTCSLRYSVRMGGFVDDDATDQGFDHSGLGDLFRRHFKRIAIEYD